MKQLYFELFKINFIYLRIAIISLRFTEKKKKKINLSGKDQCKIILVLEKKNIFKVLSIRIVVYRLHVCRLSNMDAAPRV